MNKITITVIAVLSIACIALLWRVDNLSQKNKTLSASLKTANSTIEQHEENIKITERANNEYQTNIAKLNSDIKRLRQRPAKCVPIASTPDIHNQSRQGRGHDSKNGISSGWLYEYAIEAETYRLERNACKNFVNQVWENK